MKTFRPTVVAPEKTMMHAAYGITDVRADELCAALDRLARSLSSSVTPLHYVVDQVADLADTPEEYTFCVVVHIRYMERNRDITFL